MQNRTDYLEEVSLIAEDLERLGLKPILVGGMALVILGSRRVTKDFDFLVSAPENRNEDMLDIFYERGFELASRVNKQGDILSTIDNKKIAAVRIKLDSPSSVYFLNRKIGLRVDLLFDFPFPAMEIASRSKKKRIRSHSLRIASRKDLLRLKEIAHSDRHSAADAEDLEFLRSYPQSKKTKSSI